MIRSEGPEGKRRMEASPAGSAETGEDKYKALSMWTALEAHWEGVPRKDYKLGFKRYRNALSGAVAVDHVLAFLHARPEANLQAATRDQASKLIQLLMTKHKLCSASVTETAFVDSPKSLYYLISDAEVASHEATRSSPSSTATAPAPGIRPLRWSPRKSPKQEQPQPQHQEEDASKLMRKRRSFRRRSSPAATPATAPRRSASNVGRRSKSRSFLTLGRHVMGRRGSSRPELFTTVEAPSPGLKLRGRSGAALPIRQLRAAPEPRDFPSPLRVLLGDFSCEDKWARPRAFSNSQGTKPGEGHMRLNPVELAEINPEFVLREELLKMLLRHLGLPVRDFLREATRLPDPPLARRGGKTDDVAAKPSGLYGESITAFKDGMPRWLKAVVKHLNMHAQQGGDFHSITVFGNDKAKVIFKTRESCEAAVRKYFTRLPEPVIPMEMLTLFARVSLLHANHDEAAAECLNLWACLLPERHKALLRFMTPFWSRLGLGSELGPAAYNRKLLPLLLGRSVAKETLDSYLSSFSALIASHGDTFATIPDEANAHFLLKLAHGGTDGQAHKGKTDQKMADFVLALVAPPPTRGAAFASG